jgi:hypothetical protein
MREMFGMRRRIVFQIVVAGLMVGSIYNSCTPSHDGSGGGSFAVLQSLTFAPCSFVDEQDLFSKTYWPFTRTQCASCHVEGGKGKGVIASGSVAAAFSAFSFAGYDNVNRHALDPGHHYPYSGSQNQESIDLLNRQWPMGLENIAACKGGAVGPDPTTGIDESTRIETIYKGINAPADGTPTSVVFDLSKELNDKNGTVVLPQVGSALLKINVKRKVLGMGLYYEFYDPSLTAAGTDVRIKSLLIKINGKLVGAQTTFRYVDSGVYAGQTEFLAPGAMIIDGTVAATDAVAISIGSLEPVVLPPPPPKPTVSFSQLTYSVCETASVTDLSICRSGKNGQPGPGGLSSYGNAYVGLTVRLDSPSVSFVTVSLRINEANVPANLLASNRKSMTISFNGVTQIVDRWDWDYMIPSLNVYFQPGETTKFVTMVLSNDQRFEDDEEVKVSIASAANANIDGLKGSTVVQIVDDDPAESPLAMKFSSLMQPGGILYDNCLECHNSNDNRGGYNLSDYDLMIFSDVLRPSVPMQSLMYVRMNSVAPGIDPMPLQGLLSTTDRGKVEQWIQNGARNN